MLGLCWGLAFAPQDAKQGNSFRIIYIHVPASFLALAGYYVMAIAGAVGLGVGPGVVVVVAAVPDVVRARDVGSC